MVSLLGYSVQASTALYVMVGSTLFIAGGIVGSTVKGLLTPDVVEPLELEHGNGFTISEAAGSSGGVSGLLSSVGEKRQKSKALSDGHVRWHLLDSAFTEPKYVAPERKNGGNIPELKHDDQVYLFPKDAALPGEEDGVPVVVHRKGESEPINLRDSWGESIDASSLAEYLTTRVAADSPESQGGLGLDFLADMDSMDMLRLLIIGLVIAFVALEVL